MTQQLKSASPLKLLPLLVLVQWLGVTGSISALDPAAAQAVTNSAEAPAATPEQPLDPPGAVSTNAADLETVTPAVSTSSAYPAAEPVVASVAPIEQELPAQEPIAAPVASIAEQQPLTQEPSAASVASKAEQESVATVIEAPTPQPGPVVTTATGKTTSEPTPKKAVLALEEAATKATATEAAAQEPIKFEAPFAKEPLVPEAAPAVTPSPSSTDVAAESKSEANSESSAYIDTTDYSIGATQPEPAQPSQVVVTDRATGCQASFQGQGVLGSLCGASSPAPAREAAPTPARMVYTNSGAGDETAGTEVNQNQFEATVESPVLPAPPEQSVSSTPSTRVAFTGAISSPAPSQQVSHPQYTTAAVPSGYRLMKPLKWLVPAMGRFMFPLPIPAPISSAFGWRIHPLSGISSFHSGTDLAAPMGTPVLAADSGKVLAADWLGGYGLSVLMEHNKGQEETRYSHLSQLLVRPGQWVKKGTVIGLVGSTGNSTGPHLHYELLQATSEGMVAVDPGEQLQQSLAQLVKALQTAQAKPQKSNNQG